jgi:sigma-B regulation protein RsbU (phosphoserine phosphatase)
MLAEMQERLLPRAIPQPPGWELAAYTAADRSLSQGYFDVLNLSDGRLLLFIADPSDEGASATALVAVIRAVVHSCPLTSGADRLPFCPLTEAIQPPHIILGHLNWVLTENSLEEQFMTAFCATLDTLDGNLHYANAGHPPPRLRRASDGSVGSLPSAFGAPLGLDQHTTYHHKRIHMDAGDTLILYSDALTAAQNDRGQFFGLARLDQAIGKSSSEDAEGVKAAILAKLQDFLGHRAPAEDVTLMVVRRTA